MLTNRDREVLTWIENYKAITISQASALFFSNSYESARRRLKQLEKMQFLKSYLLKNTKEKIYYYDKKISKHDLLVYDFVKIIKEHGGELQTQCYNTFPIIIIARPTEGIRYNSKNFHVVYLDLIYNNISNLLLQNSNIV